MRSHYQQPEESLQFINLLTGSAITLAADGLNFTVIKIEGRRKTEKLIIIMMTEQSRVLLLFDINDSLIRFGIVGSFGRNSIH